MIKNIKVIIEFIKNLIYHLLKINFFIKILFIVLKFNVLFLNESKIHIPEKNI
jgi:hypothetical protein